jgi:hypothetical protein
MLRKDYHRKGSVQKKKISLVMNLNGLDGKTNSASRTVTLIVTLTKTVLSVGW